MKKMAKLVMKGVLLLVAVPIGTAALAMLMIADFMVNFTEDFHE